MTLPLLSFFPRLLERTISIGSGRSSHTSQRNQTNFSIIASYYLITAAYTHTVSQLNSCQHRLGNVLFVRKKPWRSFKDFLLLDLSSRLSFQIKLSECLSKTRKSDGKVHRSIAGECHVAGSDSWDLKTSRFSAVFQLRPLTNGTPRRKTSLTPIFTPHSDEKSFPCYRGRNRIWEKR